jgi:hypothetical protein
VLSLALHWYQCHLGSFASCGAAVAFDFAEETLPFLLSYVSDSQWLSARPVEKLKTVCCHSGAMPFSLLTLSPTLFTNGTVNFAKFYKQPIEGSSEKVNK